MTTAVSPSVGKGKNKTYDPYALRKSAKTPWGNPVVYFFSLLLVALCVGPVLYIIIGGFDNQCADYEGPGRLARSMEL